MNDVTSTKQELSFGDKAVGKDFNPGGHAEVNQIKEFCAGYIDYLNNLRSKSDNNEVKRMLSVAITEAQTSQMWGVKAVTWKY
jgi:hypothetical protein